jgi:very-short-patch-repair endonuclease
MSNDIDRVVTALAESQHGVVGIHQLTGLGVTQRQRANRLAIGRWSVVHEGAYRVAGAPRSWKGDLLAACWAGGTRAVASHRSAAALWELPGASREHPEIMCPRWRRARHDGLIVHESKALGILDRTTVDGIPVTTPERTLLALGAACSPPIVERALENALRRDLVTLGSLAGTLRRLGRQGRKGVATLRALVDERDPTRRATESEMETALLQVLLANGLSEPMPQFDVHSGRVFVGRVDFAYPEQRVAIEYDSYEHHVGKRALVRDSARRNALLATGWIPLAATAEDLRAGGYRFAAAVRAALRRAA